jgi:diguanylate cyclase (GGDEF)-like protein
VVGALSSGARSWATHQLAEFLAAVGSFDEAAAAMRDAVERAAEAFEAEVGAILGKGSIEASIGFARGEVPEADLRAVAAGTLDALEVPGVGRCEAISVPIDDPRASRLVLARHSAEGFDPEEANLLRGMARVLALTLRTTRVLEAERAVRRRSEAQGEENLRLLASLRERQKLLERLSRIQRSIVSRSALEDVLESIVGGARELLGDEVVGLRLVDESDPSRMNMVATTGVKPQLLEATQRGHVGEGAGGRSITEGRLVVIEDYQQSSQGHPRYVADGIRAAMAAPVRERGEVVGSLVVGTRRQGRTYSNVEREMLLAFAEHASLALNDAKTVEEAIHQAFHDSLTELPNRALLLDRLQHALARAARSGSRVAVLFMDLDTFKTVNDSLGHAAGDELLVAVARRLIDCVRVGDTAARFGGDEFVVLLEDVDDEEDVATAAQRILDALQEPFGVQGRDVFISASIGIAIGSNEAEDLLRNADLALYKAKTNGKGRHEVFQRAMHVAVLERLELEGDLQRALQKDEFTLHYQPIYKLRTGEIAGVEALVRWRHPERGLLAPGEFIPLAEDTRIILPLGRWVLHEACRQAARWRREHPGHEALAVSVNLSSAQLGEAAVVDEVRAALRDSGLDPQSLILELTETAFLEHTDGVAARLWQLKSLGVQLAVDDFGTGYSSLQHLRRFPIDVLKIAKSFVDGLGGASDESALARAIIDLGGSFQLRVVAEGIETEDQVERLRELGCDLVQGFHFAKPLEPSALGELLARGTRATLP